MLIERNHPDLSIARQCELLGLARSSLGDEFCVRALEGALALGVPEIFITDQGTQFTSAAFTGLLEKSGIQISMDGRGRVFDNIFVERLWRTVKYEEVHLKDYSDLREARMNLGAYFRFYNEERPHQALAYRTPAEVYLGRRQSGREEHATMDATIRFSYGVTRRNV